MRGEGCSCKELIELPFLCQHSSGEKWLSVRLRDAERRRRKETQPYTWIGL